LKKSATQSSQIIKLLNEKERKRAFSEPTTKQQKGKKQTTTTTTKNAPKTDRTREQSSSKQTNEPSKPQKRKEKGNISSVWLSNIRSQILQQVFFFPSSSTNFVKVCIFWN